MNCTYHPNAEAAHRCLSCAVPVCDSCMVQMKHESYCKKCIANLAGGAKNGEHSPALAAILSFIIGGAGQMYNGETGKGILIFFTSWLVIPWLYGIFNAYLTAKKIKEGAITPKTQSGCLIAPVIIAPLIFLIIPVFGLIAAIAVPNFVKSKHAALGGHGMGDQVMIDIQNVIAQTGEAPGTAPRQEAAKFDNIMGFGKRETHKVYLKNGHIFEAAIETETPDMFIFRIDRGTFEVLKTDVYEIHPLE
ncbi:MAG: hypothetical protein ABH875_05445 [Candidatus Omnitrophota bacterium]